MVSLKQIGIVALLLLSLFAIPTLAANDFSAGGKSLLEVHQADSIETTITITNTGSLATDYALDIDGKAGKWATVTPESILLAPGKQGKLTIKYDVPAHTTPGIYDVYTTIEDRQGYQKVLYQVLNVLETQNIGLVATTYNQSVNACTEANFELELINTGTFEETYNLEANKFDEELSFSEESITLAAGEMKMIEVKVLPESCTAHGEHTIKVTVETEKSRLYANVDLDLEVKADGIVSISGPSTITNSYKQTEHKYTITNEGPEASFTVAGTIPSFITVEPKTQTIEEKGKASFTLVANPTEGSEAGEYPLTIEVSSDASSNKYTYETNMHLNTPTFFQRFYRERPATSHQILIGLAALIVLLVGQHYFRKSDKYKSMKKKMAKKKEQRKKAREKKKAAKEAKRKAKEKELAKIRAKKEKDKLKRELQDEIKKEYKLIAKKEFLSKTSSKMKKWIFGILLALLIIAAGIATWHFWSFIQDHMSYFKWGMISAAALIVIIVLGEWIQGMRRRKQKWKLLESRKAVSLITGWKDGIAEMRFKLSGAVKKAKIVLKKQKKPELEAPEGKTYQYFKVRSNFDEKGVSEAQFKFRVKKSWLKKINGLESQVRLKRYHNGKWTGIKTEKVTEDKKYIFFQAKTDSFGLFAITGKDRPKPRNKKLLWYILGGLVVLAVAFNAIFLAPAGPGVVAGIPAQIWDEDTQHSLDLTQYFTDADGDVLEFTHTKTEHITIDITSGIATFTPDKNFSGEERVIFTAIDSEGATANSNIVKLMVVKRSELIPSSVKDAISPFKYQIMVGFAILILAILGLEYRRHKKNK